MGEMEQEHVPWAQVKVSPRAWHSATIAPQRVPGLLLVCTAPDYRSQSIPHRELTLAYGVRSKCWGFGIHPLHHTPWFRPSPRLLQSVSNAQELKAGSLSRVSRSEGSVYIASIRYIASMAIMTCRIVRSDSSDVWENQSSAALAVAVRPGVHRDAGYLIVWAESNYTCSLLLDNQIIRLKNEVEECGL